jgi:uncharacterized protein YprB with RNaseH-like and TPR domain
MLFIDIETAPAVVYSFSLFKPFIGIDQIIEPSRIICFSARWGDKKKGVFYSEYEDGPDAMFQALHELLDRAEVLVHFNGKRFDTPWILGELIQHGFKPPSPFKQIDLYQVVKGNMRSLSNKLDYISYRLLGDQKVAHTGFKLWRDCLGTDEAAKAKAWKLMKKYNIQDVDLMIPLYERLQPWIKQHPNAAIHEDKDGCPTCASTNYQKRGFSYVGVSKYQRYQCTDCGAWFKDGHALAKTAFRPAT